MNVFKVLLELVYLKASAPFVWYTRGMFVYFAKQKFCIFRTTFHQSRALRNHKSVWFPLLSACTL